MGDINPKKKIIVTSALPYANGSIHLGHLVEYIQTDIFVRFLRMIGEDAIYCCADDTHGTPIEINAKKLGVSPEQLIARFYKEHVDDFSRFGIRFDSYYSTNSPENRHYADLIFARLKDNGHIYTKDMELTFCENCNRFLPDRFVKGTCPKCGAEDQYGDVCEKCSSTHKTTDLIDPKCAVCGKPPVRRTSKHYFFRLGQFSEKLRDWLTMNEELQDEVRNHVLAWINDGLEDWCISRDGPYFGFNIPGEKDKYYYVWLDAPVGYIASTANYCRQNGLDADDYWQTRDKARIIHFIGKDIIYFHLLFWPAMLMGSGFHVPDKVFVHGFLTINREKMSKSRGTFLMARDYLKVLDPIYLRYYYAANLSSKMVDIDLDLKDFKDRINNEFIANTANLTYRVLSFTEKNFDSQLGSLPDDEDSRQVIDEISLRFDIVKKHYSEVNFREAMKEINIIANIGNKYFQKFEPWKLIKDDKGRVQKIITLSANIVKNIAILFKPIIPKFSESVEMQMGLKDLGWKDLDFSLENHRIVSSAIIVKKIEDEPDKLIQPTKSEDGAVSGTDGSGTDGSVAGDPGIDVSGTDGIGTDAVSGDDSGNGDIFSRLDLRVASILEIRDHPEADRLYIMKIDLGTEQRQLVAGLRSYLSKDELKGKHIIVIRNLKPAKLRGFESQGMLLAAQAGEKVRVLEAENSDPGDAVFTVSPNVPAGEISFEEFSKLDLKVGPGRDALHKGKALKTDKEYVFVDLPEGSKIR
ncbi:methionine--tRNA ligase [Candidatus Woesearchaeota archaeon]|nr:methionine--tRNA ligase [Candidatus Woesearchaeota archaeon]